MRPLLRSGTGALLVVAIMFIGSLGLWVGTPLLWLWVGSQIQGATQSLGTALAAAFFGVVLTVAVVASLLSRLSDVYRPTACRAASTIRVTSCSRACSWSARASPSPPS